MWCKFDDNIVFFYNFDQKRKTENKQQEKKVRSEIS